jgi:hypothetical protein
MNNQCLSAGGAVTKDHVQHPGWEPHLKSARGQTAAILEFFLFSLGILRQRFIFPNTMLNNVVFLISLEIKLQSLGHCNHLGFLLRPNLNMYF